ncbi:GIY-YIG nuclease family protein [Phyllobacterium sp. K27]
MNKDLNVEALYAIGFQQVAQWKLNDPFLSYEVEVGDEDRLKPLFDVGNALYAFCKGADVLYIGKTTQSLKRRMIGYCRPGKTQATNLRCNEKIRAAAEKGVEVFILAFAPTNQLQFGGFEIKPCSWLRGRVDTTICSCLERW